MGEAVNNVHTDKGFSLIEVVFALSILLVVALGLVPLGVIASNTSENQGHLVARSAEYASDKLEQLLSLAYGDSISDTRHIITQSTGGSGLTIGGSFDPDAPVANYVDYLDEKGSLLTSSGTTAPAGWFYKRVWRVEQQSTNLKRITVTAIVRSAVGNTGRVPQTTVSALKTFPF